MAKHTQTIRWQKLRNCLSVFDHFVGLAPKGLTKSGIFGCKRYSVSFKSSGRELCGVACTVG